MNTIIKELLDSERNHAQWFVLFETDARFEIIARNVFIKGIDDIDIIRDLTQRAIAKLAQSTDPQPDNFSDILEQDVNEHLALPFHEHTIIFAANLRDIELANITPFDLFDVQIRLSNWHQVQRSFEYEKWIAEFDGRDIIAENELVSYSFVPLIASSRGRTVDEGFAHANEVISLFRAILNLAADNGSRRFGDPPLGELLPSPIYGVFDNTGKFQTGYYTLQRYKHQRNIFPVERLKSFTNIVTSLRKPTAVDDTMALVIDGLQKYGLAMDAVEWREAFLSLWQIFEITTLQTEHIEMRDVVSRLKIIFRNDPLIGDLLDTIKDARNDLVHRGQFSISGWKEVGFLKVLAEKIIIFLLGVTTQLPTRQHLEWYYEYASLSDADLDKAYSGTSEEFRKFLDTLRLWRHQSKRAKRK